MADSFELLAQIGIDVNTQQGRREIQNLVAAVGDAVPQVSRQATNLEKALNNVGTGATAAGRGTKDASNAANEYATNAGRATVSTNSLRYALYDVAFAYGAISAAALLAAKNVIGINAEFETAFTGVERTAGQGSLSIEELRTQLVDLSTQIPLTFQDVSGIAQLGAQLNIANQDLESFTTTVAEFGATAGTSLDATAEGFGRIGQLLGVPADEFDKLGSAILYAGNTSVATEADVLQYSQRLAQVSAQYGLSAQSVVAYASTLASVGNGLEASQGAFSRIFGKITEAVAEGGTALDNFAAVSGQTSSDFVNQWQSAPDQAFNALLQTLSGLDTITRTSILDQLGINDTRDLRTINNLANQFTFLQGQIEGVNGAYSDGTYLADSYAKKADDLASQFTIFQNSVSALIEELTGESAPAIARFLSSLSGGINGLREFVASIDPGDQIGKFVLSLIVAVGILAAYRSATALATGSLYALQTAQAGLAASGTAGGIKGLVSAMLGLNGATKAATTSNVALGASAATTGRALQTEAAAATTATNSTNKFRTALLAAGRATLIIGAIQAIIEIIFNFNEVARGFIQTIASIVRAVSGAAGVIGNFGNFLADVAGNLPLVGDALEQNFRQGALVGKNFEAVAQGLDKMADGFKSAEDSSTDLGNATPDFGAATDDADAYADSLGGGGGVADSAGDAAVAVRTLKDYANDLGTVIGRAFEIRFSGQQGFDTITSGWQAIADSTADANKEVQDYYATMQSLTADKAIKEYWLSVAENYGDALRAGELRADIGDIDNKLADASSGLTKAQDKNSKGLEGNTAGAVANRAAILGLVGNYQSYIQAMAASGATQEELDRLTAQLKQEFIAQATQLGFNQVELGKYAAAFDDVSVAIKNIPRDITVDFNGDPALQALNEFIAQAQVVAQNSGINVPIGASVDTAGLAKAARAQEIYARIAQYQNSIANTASPTAIDYYLGQISQLKNVLNSGSYATGGMIRGAGSGTSDSIVARVSDGEYVQRARAVDYYGPSFMNALNNLQIPRTMFNGGGLVGRAAATPSYSGTDMSQVEHLLSVIASKNVSFGNNLVAQTANEGDARLGGLGNG